MIDDETDATQKLKGCRQMRHALLHRRSEDEDVVEVEDASNPPCMKKRLERLGHQRENEGGEAEAKWENEVFVQKAPPTEVEKAPEALIDAVVKIGVFQVYGRSPIAGAKERSSVYDRVHPEVRWIQESLIQPLEVDDWPPTAILLRNDEDARHQTELSETLVEWLA